MSMFHRFYTWFPLVAVLCSIGLLAWQIAFRAGPALDVTFAPHPPDFSRSMQRENDWVCEDFFVSPTSLAICRVISNKDYPQLDRLLAAKPNLDEQAKYGVTVLHWAYFERDLVAFEKLLKAGASPDIVFTADIVGDSYLILMGSTLPLESLRHRFYGLPFFELALGYIRTPSQRTPSNQQTLLHTFVFRCFGVSGPKTLELVRKIIAIGVDLNAQDAEGSTAADMALGFDMPDECLLMLEAGANPDIVNAQGESLRDVLQRKLAGNQQSIDGRSLTTGLRKIEQWLVDHDRSNANGSGLFDE